MSRIGKFYVYGFVDSEDCAVICDDCGAKVGLHGLIQIAESPFAPIYDWDNPESFECDVCGENLYERTKLAR